MTYDTGFSSMKTILGRNAAIQAKDLIPEIPAISGHIVKFISLKKLVFFSKIQCQQLKYKFPSKIIRRYCQTDKIYLIQKL